MEWSCAIAGCEEAFTEVEDLLIHQAEDHEPVSCAICGETMPDGYPALRHVMADHSRAEYVRAYGANADEIRRREEVADYVKANADLEAVANHLANQ